MSSCSQDPIKERLQRQKLWGLCLVSWGLLGPLFLLRPLGLLLGFAWLGLVGPLAFWLGFWGGCFLVPCGVSGSLGSFRCLGACGASLCHLVCMPLCTCCRQRNPIKGTRNCGNEGGMLGDGCQQDCALQPQKQQFSGLHHIGFKLGGHLLGSAGLGGHLLGLR